MSVHAASPLLSRSKAAPVKRYDDGAGYQGASVAARTRKVLYDHMALGAEAVQRTRARCGARRSIAPLGAAISNGVMCLLAVTLAGVGAYVVGGLWVDFRSAIPSVDRLACMQDRPGYSPPKYHPKTHAPADYWKACYFAYECCTGGGRGDSCLDGDPGPRAAPFALTDRAGPQRVAGHERNAHENPYERCDGCMQGYAHQSLTVECEIDIDSDRRTPTDVIDDEDCWEESEAVDQRAFGDTCELDYAWCEKECEGGVHDSGFAQTLGGGRSGKHILCKYCVDARRIPEAARRAIEAEAAAAELLAGTEEEKSIDDGDIERMKREVLDAAAEERAGAYIRGSRADADGGHRGTPHAIRRERDVSYIPPM